VSTHASGGALRRFSFNQATAQHWPLPEVVAGCADAGVPGIGLWREPVAAYGTARAAKLVRDAGLAVTSLCRGGFFTTDGWRAENMRAVDEAATLGAPPHWPTPATVKDAPARAAFRSGSRSMPVAPARVSTVPRRVGDPAGCRSPTILKGSWCPASQARNTMAVL